VNDSASAARRSGLWLREQADASRVPFRGEGIINYEPCHGAAAAPCLPAFRDPTCRKSGRKEKEKKKKGGEAPDTARTDTDGAGDIWGPASAAAL
jgi:hypothetical protein